MILQEGEVATEGQACPGPAHVCCRLPCCWSVVCWPARSPRGIVLQSLSFAQVLHPIPSQLPQMGRMARTQLTSQVLWGESHPHHKLGGTCRGRAHAVWQARLCLWLYISTQPQEESPEENCSGTQVLTSQLSGTLGGVFKFHLFREGVTSDLGCRAGSTSRNGSGWCKPCPCPSLSDYLFPQRYQANSEAFKQEGGLKKHTTIMESCRQK